jgi:hypothetical protein
VNRLRPFLGPETVVLLAVFGVCQVLFRERGFYDPGALWHPRVGEIILTDGFPHTDPFTYTFAGRTWIPQQWGAEVLMALAHRWSGLDGMLVGFSAAVGLLAAWGFGRVRQAGMNPLLAGVLAGGFVIAAAFHFYVRPHMASILLLAWTTACLVDYERGVAGPWRVASLIPVFVVWTNLHAGVLCGILSLGFAVAGWGVLFLFGQESPVRNWRQGWLLIGVSLACLLTPFVNPFGMEMLNTWSRLIGSDILKVAVTEHRPLNLANDTDKVVFGAGLMYLFLFLGTLPRRPKVTWLLPLVWLALTFSAIRQGPLFCAVAVVVAADLWPHTAWHRLLKKYGDSLIQDPPDPRAGLSARGLIVPALAVAAVVGLHATRTRLPVVGTGWARLDPKLVPVPLTAAIREHARAAGPGARIYNDANLGGYLIYHLPELKIFMDDRFELYPEQWTADYVDCFWYHPERFDEWADRFGFRLVLLQADPEPTVVHKYVAARPDRWREVARADRAVLYVRQP